MTCKPAHQCNFSKCCNFRQWNNSQAGIKHRDDKLLLVLPEQSGGWELLILIIISMVFDHIQYY